MSESIRTETREPSMTPFFIVWGAQALSLVGSQLVQFALVWWLTEKTGSATVLAFATMMAVLPQIFLGPVAGALVDRWNRRIVMQVADGSIALATVVIAVLFATGAVQVWHIYVLMFLRAAGGAFHWPAMQASTTLMVPERHLSRIAGLNQSLNGIAQIAAPPLGALLLAVLPMQGILSIDISTAIVAISILFFIAIPQPERKETPGEASARPSVVADLREGLAFVWGWPGLMVILAFAMLINLLVTPAFSLLPLLVTEHFHGAAAQYATLEATIGVGMIAGGLLLSVWGGFKKRVVTAMLALIGMGTGLILVGFVPSYMLWGAVAALLVVGLMNPIANGSLFAALQTLVPPDMQGRVFTLVMAGSSAMIPIGLAVAGPLADALGVPVWFVIGGVATVLMGVSGLLIPAVMNIEEQMSTPAGAVALTGEEIAEPVPAR